MMKTLLPFAAALLLLAAAPPAGTGTAPPSRFSALVADAAKRTRRTTVAALKARLASETRAFRLIDVREDAEWALGAVPGATHIGRGVLERDVEKAVPDLETEIVVYCASGARSTLAADSLQKMGYANVYSLEGGYRAWLESGDPVARAQEKKP